MNYGKHPMEVEYTLPDMLEHIDPAIVPQISFMFFV
jgi:hypothetical protein